MDEISIDLSMSRDMMVIYVRVDLMGVHVRRLTTLLVAFLLTMGGLFATAAAPASAQYQDPPGGTLRNVYSDLQFCQSYGSYGVQNDMWSSYLCQYRQYGSPGGPYSVYYFFWTFD